MPDSPQHCCTEAGRIDWNAELTRHARWLRTVVASRVGEAAAVDDVMQQVGLAVAAGKGLPVDPQRVGPWLYRVAVKQSLQHRRTAGRRRRLLARCAEDGDRSGIDERPSPLDWLLREERLAAAGAALAALPDLDRQLLLLKYTEDWTYRQMAERLGVSVDTVEHRLQQARSRMRRQLAAAGVVEV